jgi:hypothetical protein
MLVAKLLKEEGFQKDMARNRIQARENVTNISIACWKSHPELFNAYTEVISHV